MKVFVVNYHGAYDYESSLSVRGVFDTLEKAKECVKFEFDNSLQEWLDNYDEEDVESSLNALSAYIEEAGDFTRNHEEWNIVETEVQ